MNDDMIDALNQMVDFRKPRPITAGETIADEAMHLMNKKLDALNLMIDPVHYGGGIPKMMTARETTAMENKMKMEEGELITKPIPWYVIVWEGGTVHLETTIITHCRDMALLQAGADLQAGLGSEDLNLSKCEVSCRPAV